MSTRFPFQEQESNGYCIFPFYLNSTFFIRGKKELCPERDPAEVLTIIVTENVLTR